MTTSLTVALCTHNHRPRLERTLRDLASLRSPQSPWELLVVDNASSDGTTALLADTTWRPRTASVRIVREAKLGLSHARNRAIAEAVGDYIVFLDDDETPDPEWLRAFERVIFAVGPDALGGRIEVLFEDGGRPAWLQDEVLGFLGKLDHGRAACRLVDPGTPIFGGNFAFRKAVFDRVGAFDTGLGRKGTTNVGGEDTEIYRRMLAAGCTVWWVPEAVIHHRIQVGKLRRSYFLDLHFRQGRTEGMKKRGSASRIPPRYLFGQLLRAAQTALVQRLREGANVSLRREMNLAYFVGYLYGWTNRTSGIA